MKKYNIVYASAIVCLGVFAAIYALRYSNVDRHLRVGAHTFPVVISLCLIVTGLIILIGALGNRVVPGEERPPQMRLSKVGVFVVVFVVYFILLKPLGFILTGVPMVMFCMRRLGCGSWPAIIAYSVILPSVVFAAFYYCMYVSLPLGVLESVLPKY